MIPFEVRHGSCESLLGVEHRSGGWGFTPAQVDLRGPQLQSLFRLIEVVEPSWLPDDLRRLAAVEMEALWARPQTERVFGVKCPGQEDRAEKSLMTFGFLARRLAGSPSWSVPFWLLDYHGQACLEFSGDVPRETRDSDLGESFWKLLLALQSPIPDYLDEMFHTGSGESVRFGKRSGHWIYESAQTGRSLLRSGPIPATWDRK